MRRRVVGVVVAIALAAVGTGMLLTWVRAAESRALAGERVVDVLVVREEVPQGTPAEGLRQYVETEQVPAKVVAQGSVSDLADLEGLVASVALLPGEQVNAARFVTLEQIEEQSAVEVPEGLLEVTVSLDPQRAVGGVIRPGDTVGVIASFDPFDVEGQIVVEGQDPADITKTPNTTHLILHKVLITNVQVEQLPATPEEGEEGGRASVQLAPTGNLLITLALDAGSVERVVFSAEFGRLWLTAEPEDAPEDGTRIQTRGTVYE